MRSQRISVVIFTSLLVAVCGQACMEDDPVCRQIGRPVCAPPLDSFGKTHCGIFCEQCSANETRHANETTEQSTTIQVTQPTVSPDDCGEDDPVCRELGHTTVCLPPFLDFAKRKCGIFCEFCFVNDSSTGQDTASTVPPPTTTTELHHTSQAHIQQTTPLKSAITTTLPVTHAPFIEMTTRQMTNAPSTPPPLTSDQLTTEARTRAPNTTKSGHWLFQDCNTTAEVVFVLDSSSSVGDANFQKVLEFTQRVTERLKTKYERLNITVITYNNDAKVALRLNESMDLSSMLTAEGNISYSQGGTQTHTAIELMYNAFNHDIKNPKIAVIITDGASFEPAQTRNASHYAKEHGVAIFAIGVGEDVNSHEILSISSDPDAEFLFQLNNFAALSSIVELFHSRNCPDSTTKPSMTEKQQQPVSEQTPTLKPGKLGSTVTPSAIPPFHTPHILSTGLHTPSSGSVHTPDVEPIHTGQTKQLVTLTTPVTPVVVPMETTSTNSPIAVTDVTVTDTPVSGTPITVTAIPFTIKSATDAPTTVTATPVTVKQATGSAINVTAIPVTFKLATDSPTTVMDTPAAVKYVTDAPITVTAIPVTVNQANGAHINVTDIAVTVNHATEENINVTDIHVTVKQDTNAHINVTDTFKPETHAPTIATDPKKTSDKITTPNPITVTQKITTRKPATVTDKIATPDYVTVTNKITTPDSVTVTNKITTSDYVTVTNKISTPKPVTVTDKITTPDSVTVTDKIATPKPVTVTQKITTPDSVTVTNKIATPKPVTVTQKITTPDYVTVTDKIAPPKPVTVTQKITTPDSVTVTDKIARPKPVTVTDKITTPDYVTVTDTIATQDYVTVTDKITTLKPVTVTDKIATPKPVTVTDKITTPDSVTVTDKIATPKPVTVTDKITTPDPVTVTQKITSSRPVTTTTTSITSTEHLSTTTASCIAKVADVIFVIDSSGSIGLDNFQKVKSFMKDVIRTFDVGSLYTRVALIEYGTVARIEFKLNDKANVTELLDAVDNMGYSGGGTATSDALQLMRTHGFEGERPDAPDVAIVITDGLSKFPALTRTQANLAKADEITLFSIGIGNLTDRNELLAIASDKRFLFEVGSFEALRTLDAVVAHIACGVVLPEKHHTRGTTTPSTTPSGCVDLSADCASYPRDSCTDFQPYARKNCARTCGYCPGFPLVEPPCEDAIGDCEPYGTSMCYIPAQYGWVDANCRKFCGFCGNKTELQITTPPPTTPTTTASFCEDKIAKCEEYNADLCTNNDFVDFARKNCRKYCGFCYNYKYVTSAMVNHVKCPAWALPEHCTLEYTTPGQCCPSPKCPDGYRLTIERHVR